MSPPSDGDDDTAGDVVGYHLSTTNAERACGVCNDDATAYIHGVGFRCGDCYRHAPTERAPATEGGPLGNAVDTGAGLPADWADDRGDTE